MKNRLPVWLLVVSAALPCAQAQETEEPQDDSQQAIAGHIQQILPRVFRVLEQLGPWEDHAGLLTDAVEKIYTRNGWNSDADQFSLEMFRKMQALPPLALRERYDTALAMVSDRYLLNESQEKALRDILKRESRELFQQNSGVMVECAGNFIEALETRASGEAITPEQVARWVKADEPIFRNLRQRLGHASQAFLEQLTPEQRELVQQDMNAFRSRMDRMEQLRGQWAQGKWQAGDWGMEADPIQVDGETRLKAGVANRPARGNAGEEPANEAAPVAAGAPPPPAGEPRLERALREAQPVPAAQAEDAWADYVRRFIRKFKLDEAQQQKAWKLYEDKKGRAATIRLRSGKRLEDLRRQAGGKDGAAATAALQKETALLQGALDRLFQELKEKLNVLPTRAQRRNAEPGDLDPPPPSEGP